jgi:hypothetical protein
MVTELPIQADNQSTNYQARKHSRKINFAESNCFHEGEEYYDWDYVTS